MHRRLTCKSEPSPAYPINLSCLFKIYMKRIPNTAHTSLLYSFTASLLYSICKSLQRVSNYSPECPLGTQSAVSRSRQSAISCCGITQAIGLLKPNILIGVSSFSRKEAAQQSRQAKGPQTFKQLMQSKQRQSAIAVKAVSWLCYVVGQTN